MRPIFNIAFVLLALIVASQAAPLDDTPSEGATKKFVISAPLPNPHSKDPVARQGEEGNDTPSFTSARNTNDTPSRTMEGSIPDPTADSQSGCHCPSLCVRINSLALLMLII